MLEPLYNFAYIDGQNLYMGTKSCALSWEVDLAKFKVYLEKRRGMLIPK